MFSKLGTKIALHKAGLGNVTMPQMPTFPKTEPGAKGAESDEGAGFQNPFANVQWGKAFSSWQSPPAPPNPIAQPPAVGARAPSNMKMKFPAIDGRPCVVLFLRYCGCPFTEKLFIHMRSLANRHTGIRFIAISHCTPEATQTWCKNLGGAWNIDVIVDSTRELYALWGLGLSNWGHLLHPRNGYNQYLLGKKEGVWGSQVGDGGCRWQTGGVWAVDDKGMVRWGAPMKSVDEQIEFEAAVRELGFGGQNRSGIF